MVPSPGSSLLVSGRSNDLGVGQEVPSSCPHCGIRSRYQVGAEPCGRAVESGTTSLSSWTTTGQALPHTVPGLLSAPCHPSAEVASTPGRVYLEGDLEEVGVGLGSHPWQPPSDTGISLQGPKAEIVPSSSTRQGPKRSASGFTQRWEKRPGKAQQAGSSRPSLGTSSHRSGSGDTKLTMVRPPPPETESQE